MGLAPGHDLLAAEAAVGPQQDAHLRPSRPDLRNDPLQLRDGAKRSVVVGRAQLGRQQVLAAEDVQGQVTEFLVIAVEEAALLMAVQRVVGGVEIEGDLRRCRTVSVEKEVDEHGLDLGCIIADLVVARWLRPAQFQSVERRFAGQRRAIRALGFEFPAEHGHHRVITQLVVIDQVLVAQRNPEHPLPDHPRHRVLDQLGHAVIGEAAGEALDQPDLPVGGTQQHRPGLRGHPAAVKPGHHRAPFHARKAKQIRATLRLHRAPPVPEINRSQKTIFSDLGPRCTYPR